MEYKSIRKILETLSAAVDDLDNGKLSVKDLDKLLQDARELHERIAILQYLSVKPNSEGQAPKKKSSFSFGVDTNAISMLREPTNQTNLLDAIESEIEPIEITKEEVKTEEPKADINPGLFEPVEEIKTEEDAQDELKDEDNQVSVNDKYSNKVEQPTLAEKLGKKPISNLVEAIGLNQKFLFMNDLFEGENGNYKEALNQLNNFNNYIEADQYMDVLKSKHNWDVTSQTTKDFIELVQRRYS